MFVSCKAACRDDGAATANTAALGLPTSQRHPPTLPAAYHCYLGLVYKTDDTLLFVSSMGKRGVRAELREHHASSSA